MKSKIKSEPGQVLFIEFATSPRYEGLKPFAFATSDNRRYDVDYDPKNDVLVHRCCAYGRFYPFCYLENAEHQYWAREDIIVTKNNGQPASPENRIDLPEEYCEYREGKFYEWPGMVEA